MLGKAGNVTCHHDQFGAQVFGRVLQYAIQINRRVVAYFRVGAE